MTDPLFLHLDQVLKLHKREIDLYGGTQGLRDEALLKSAIAQPESSYNNVYLHQDIYLMAAAYLFHLVQNHPFIDGNKRIGARAAFVFLLVNGLEVIADEDEFESLVMATSNGLTKKSDIAEFFQKNTKKA